MRDDSGREFAVYDVTTDRLKMINLYGSDLIGRIDVSWNYSTRSDARKFYVKDHLGSIRQTLNESGTVMSAMDYYAFGGTLSSYVNGNTIDKYKFTGKERDSETGLDYFGARYYDSKIGRWMSVDPLAEKYPGLSPYNYCLNSPLRNIDPNGKDAIPVVFKDYKISVMGMKVPYLGHAGILLIDNKTGKTSYYEYGRYDREGKGIVKTYSIPNVKMDSKTGMPTTESLNKVLGVISKNSGQGGNISGAYIKNDNYKAMKDYAENRKTDNTNENRNEYSIFSNSCGTFMKETLEAGGVDTPSMVDPRPNSYIEELRDEHPDVNYDSKKKQTEVEQN